jgi:hypothetical protein
MKFVNVKVSRFIPGPVDEVFDVWFDPESPGGPWHGAKKAILNLAVDGMFYFGIERALAKVTGVAGAGDLLAHFGRFTEVDRPHAAAHSGCPNSHEGSKRSSPSRSSHAKAARN